MRFRVALVALGFVVFSVGCGEEEKFKQQPPPIQPDDPAPLVEPSCEDGVKNQDESDSDCGGATCVLRCAEGKMCGADSDCESRICDTSRCLTIPPNEGDFVVRCRVTSPSPADHPCQVRVDHPSLPGDGLGPGYAIQSQVNISVRTLCTTKMQREELGEVLHFTGRVWNISFYEWHQGYVELLNPNGTPVQRALAASPYEMKAMSTREWMNCRELGYPQSPSSAP